MHIPALKVIFSDVERKQILERIDQSLQSGFLSQGHNVQEFEERFASYIKVRHAVAVNSGSSAIEIVMRALKVEGKQVIVPTNTFLATATGVLLAGGDIRLADIDPTTFSPSLYEIQQRVTSRTIGVILTHIGGIISPEILAIRSWCDQQGLWLFEDAAHAHGSRLGERNAGAFGIAGGYSFFATKVMTCGEGGMIVTDNDELAEFSRLYRNHGKPNPWVSYHTHMGSNHRMNDIMAAIALSQFAHLDDTIAARAHVAKIYTTLLESYIPDLKPVLPTDCSSWYKYIVLLPEEIDRSSFKQYMKEHGVDLPGGVYEIPLHQQPVFQELISTDSFANADDVCRRHICLPIYPSLTDEEIKKIVVMLAEALKNINK